MICVSLVLGFGELDPGCRSWFGDWGRFGFQVSDHI